MIQSITFFVWLITKYQACLNTWKFIIIFTKNLIIYDRIQFTTYIFFIFDSEIEIFMSIIIASYIKMILKCFSLNLSKNILIYI